VICAACSGAHRGPDGTTRGLITRAEDAESRRDYTSARALYQRAVDEAPDAVSKAVAARAFGRALIFWGEYEEAEIQLDQAAALAPGDAGTWHDVGMVRHHRGDTAGAEAALRRSIAASPRDARSRIALAALLVNARRYADALREYEALAELELPARIREKVTWAIGVLRKRQQPPRPR